MSRWRNQAVGRGRTRGQAMVELLIAAPVVFFMILMIVQMVLLYRIKSTLDYAALMTARAGAVSGLKRGDMQAAFAKGMMPLYAHRTGMTELERAYAKARADLLLFGDITVVNPTRAAWNEFKERQYNGQYALPNDSLAYRSHAVGSSGVNVQDANLLKVKLTYDAPLVVPFVGWVLGGKSQYLKAGTFESSPLTTLTRRLRIESYAIVRMQSPIYDTSMLSSATPGSGGGPGGLGGTEAPSEPPIYQAPGDGSDEPAPGDIPPDESPHPPCMV